MSKFIDLTYAGKEHKLLVLDNQKDWELGMNHPEVNDGVIMMFPEDMHVHLTMEKMKFPLDVIYLDKDMKVLRIENNVTKDLKNNFPTRMIAEVPSV